MALGCFRSALPKDLRPYIQRYRIFFISISLSIWEPLWISGCRSLDEWSHFRCWWKRHIFRSRGQGVKSAETSRERLLAVSQYELRAWTSNISLGISAV